MYNCVQFEETKETVGEVPPRSRNETRKGWRASIGGNWASCERNLRLRGIDTWLWTRQPEPGRRSVPSIPTTGTELPGSSAAPPPPAQSPTTTTTTTVIGHYHGNRRMRILTSVQPTVSTCQVVQVLAKRLLPSTDRFHPRIFPPGERVRGISCGRRDSWIRRLEDRGGSSLSSWIFRNGFHRCHGGKTGVC